MPWIPTFDTERDLIFVFLYGNVTDAEVRAGVSQVLGDPRFHKDIRMFSDLSWVTGISVTAETVGQLANDKLLASASRQAFYAPTDIGFGMVRMYQFNVEFHYAGQVGVFRERSEALAWINKGIPEERHLRWAQG